MRWYVLEGGERWRCKKLEVNRANTERVTLPTAPSVSSGDLVPDVRLTSADVRADVTTKGLFIMLLSVTFALLTLQCFAVPVTIRDSEGALDHNSIIHLKFVCSLHKEQPTVIQ